MSSLKLVVSGSQTLLIEADGTVNAPLSIYLRERYDNPHTREVVATGLRVLHRFLLLHHIDLPGRALDGECLRSVECEWLKELVYRPIDEIDQMSDLMLRRITIASRASAAMDRRGAVEPNTAAKRLNTAASFLDWYRRTLLTESIRSPATRRLLEERYAVVCGLLDEGIARTTQGHHHEIRSLPTDRYLKIIGELVVNPERLFLTTAGRRSSTLLRDRAIALLAAEGLRPGAIGNLTIDDFRHRPGDKHGYIVIKDNTANRDGPLTTAVPKAKGTRSTQQNYNSDITVRIWPFTASAIVAYLQDEREGRLNKKLANRSRSFLFLTAYGTPIGDRTTVALVFSRLAARLKACGLLDISVGDPFSSGTYYSFSAYTLRHSAATFFYSTHAHEANVKDLMCVRFGWTSGSSSPDRYANRAMSEAASVDMSEFYETLLQHLESKQEQQRRNFR